MRININAVRSGNHSLAPAVEELALGIEHQNGCLTTDNSEDVVFRIHSHVRDVVQGHSIILRHKHVVTGIAASRLDGWFCLMIPDLLYGLFLRVTDRIGGALGVGRVGAQRLVGTGDHPGHRHLEVPVRVGFLNPVVGIPQALVSVCLRLESQPRYFIPTPNTDGRVVGNIWGPGPAKIVELNQIRQTLTTPSAWGGAALPPLEEGIEVSHLQNGLVGLSRDGFDTQRKRVEIQEADSIPYHAPARDMAIHQDQMAASVCFRISAHLCQELRVYLQVSILRADESDLPQVEGFTSVIDVGDREIVEPKLGFGVINNRNPAPSSGTARTSARPFDYRITGKR